VAFLVEALRVVLRLRVAAAFLPAALRFAALRRRVAAAFLAAAEREALVERVGRVDALRLAVVERALRFLVAAAFLAAAERFAALRRRVAAAFFAAADRDAFVDAIRFTLPFLGGLTRMRF